MDRKTIAERALNLKNKEDLLNLVNDLVKDELGNNSFAFTIKQLDYYCNPNINVGRYEFFDIPKKRKGKRHIAVPNKYLKNILYYLKIILNSIYEPNNCVMGFVENRCIVDNAKIHIKKNYIYNLDLEDFFTTITKTMVWRCLLKEPFNYSPSFANDIAGLCCVKAYNNGNFYFLPQGAPTSPIISNIVCKDLDIKLESLARRYNATYSRYADDITFSSMHNIYDSKTCDFIDNIKSIINNEGFKINENKTRLQKSNKRQEVTGLIVNTKVNTPKEYCREMRTILHIWENYGYKDAYNSFIKNNPNKKEISKIENVIDGKLCYLQMVKGKNDVTYKKLKDRYVALRKRDEDIILSNTNH